jgi:hypothetical protein
MKMIKDQDEKRFATLRAMIDEGDASGIAEGDVFERLRKKYNLPLKTVRVARTDPKIFEF